MVAGGGPGGASGGGPHSLDPVSLEMPMDYDPSVCYLGMFRIKQSEIDFIVRFLIYGKGLRFFDIFITNFFVLRRRSAEQLQV